MRQQGSATVPILLIWPSVNAWRIDGAVWLDRKFKVGMDATCERWPGRVRVIMEVTDVPELSPFGAWRWGSEEARFDLEIIEPGRTLTVDQLRDVDVLVASADDYRQLEASRLCAASGTACIYVIEYTLRTRFDLTRHSTAPWSRKLKNMLWHVRNEMRVSRAIRAAHGIQANGLPAYRAYERSTPSPQLYFDTRLPRAAIVSPAALDERLARLRRGGPLRLAFSGRLIAAKGGDALVPLARQLRERGIPFVLDIYGSGELSDTIAADIAAHGLQDAVHLRGPVDFDDVLMPTLRRSVDLFVCCHRQGDPSCTYAETLGCGVPIVGFANESLASLVQAHDIGWTVGMGDVGALADLIGRLSRQRDEIADKSRLAMRFADEHHFETAYDLRTSHCVRALTR